MAGGPHHAGVEQVGTFGTLRHYHARAGEHARSSGSGGAAPAAMAGRQPPAGVHATDRSLGDVVPLAPMDGPMEGPLMDGPLLSAHKPSAVPVPATVSAISN
eukprot:7428510-Pyramimonas_sp.AAC.1